MDRKLRLACGVIGALVALSSDVLRADDAPAAAPPPEPAEAAPDWTQRPDFEALRAAWGVRDDFGRRCEIARPMREAFERMDAEKWGEVLELATAWVERCPVDMDAHVVRTIALEHSGRSAEAEHHRVWTRGLFEAVMATGDGKTPETAYQVLAVHEEYSLLRFFRYEPKQQRLTEHGIDALTVLAEGEERTIYFNPAASFERMRKQLEGANEAR